MRRAGIAVLLALGPSIGALGCQESEPPAPATSSSVAAPEAIAAPLDEEAGDEDDEEIELAEPPSGDPLPLDEMDRPALEAACFEGRQAACDRLGH